MLSHTHTHTYLFIHRSKPTDFRMVLAVESVLCSVCPWWKSTSDEKELEFSLVRQTWRLRIVIYCLFLICLTLLFFFCVSGWKTRGKLSSQPSTRKYQMASWKSKVNGFFICSESVRCLRSDESNWLIVNALLCKARRLGKFHFIKCAMLGFLLPPYDMCRVKRAGRERFYALHVLFYP